MIKENWSAKPSCSEYTQSIPLDFLQQTQQYTEQVVCFGHWIGYTDQKWANNNNSYF
jgi:hypothetical protein